MIFRFSSPSYSFAQAFRADRSVTVVQGLVIAYQEMIERAHASGIRVYGATLLPFGSFFYDETSSQPRPTLITNPPVWESY